MPAPCKRYPSRHLIKLRSLLYLLCLLQSYIETLRLAEWDAHAYEARMKSSISLPDGDTAVALTPQQRLIAVMHTYLSHLGFKCQSGTRLTLQDSNGVNGTLLYTLEGIDSDTMQFALEASYKPLPASNAFDCYIQMYCVQRGEIPFSDCDRMVSFSHVLASPYPSLIAFFNLRVVGISYFLNTLMSCRISTTGDKTLGMPDFCLAPGVEWGKRTGNLRMI